MPAYRSVNVSKLIPGDTLVEPVFNERLTKLLGSGCTVSELLISRLADLGITEVIVENAAQRTGKQPRKAILPEYSMTLDCACDVPRLVEHCCECGTIIAIQPPVPDLSVATWLCKTCGSAYFGCAGTTNFRGIELFAGGGNPLTSDDEDQSELKRELIPPANTEGLACGSATHGFTGNDRRRQKRYPAAVPVVAVPLRADFSIAGQAVRMTTRNISQGGVAVAHTRFSDVPYYVLDFTAAGIELLQVVLKVLRVRNCGPIPSVPI